jgi:hypothetical protein
LAKAERLQAERLRKLMLDMSASSASDESRVLYNSTANSNSMFATNLTHIEENDQEFEVEIQNFDQKSSLPPASVYVVKEQQLQSQPQNKRPNMNVTRSLTSIKPKQTTELINFDGEVISRPSDIYTRLDHHKLKANKSEPELVATRITSAAAFKQQHEAYTIPARSCNEPARPLGDAKLSLQDAFKAFKSRAMERSQKRQAELQKRSEDRRQRAEFERRVVEINMKHREEEKRRAREVYWANYAESLVGANQRTNRRVMTAQEIKSLTRKNYEKLPEVKEKLDRERVEKAKRMNKIKSAIYTKVFKLFFGINTLENEKITCPVHTKNETDKNLKIYQSKEDFGTRKKGS